MLGPRPAVLRHIIVLVLAVLLGGIFLLSRAEWSEMHRYNRALGDVSLVFISVTMALGPAARLVKSRWARKLLLFRRELGIWAVFTALIHTIIILVGWVELDLWRLFGFEYHPQMEKYVMVRHGFALGNSIGVLALLYGTVLASTSNDWSQRALGHSVWKFLQQGAYVLWWLVVVHTGYFLFVHFLDYHRRTPEPNWAQFPFIAMVSFVVILQSTASVVTWQRARLRERAGPGGKK